jgi:LemA protein
MTTTILIGTGIVFLFLVLFVIWGYNSFIVLDNRIKNALGQINVQLKRRIDLIPNLVETVKGYAKHEKSVFENVTKARTSMISADAVNDKLKANNSLTAALKTLFAVAENYPKLQANENFVNLQNELAETEDKIAYARQFYNDTVLMYNNKAQMFPTNILARIFGFRTRDSFTISAEEAKKPEVHF